MSARSNKPSPKIESLSLLARVHDFDKSKWPVFFCFFLPMIEISGFLLSIMRISGLILFQSDEKQNDSNFLVTWEATFD